MPISRVYEATAGGNENDDVTPVQVQNPRMPVYYFKTIIIYTSANCTARTEIVMRNDKNNIRENTL